MYPGYLFIGVRIFEVISLIPIWGMLAWFVDLYQPAIPHDYILYPFIVSLPPFPPTVSVRPLF